LFFKEKRIGGVYLKKSELFLTGIRIANFDCRASRGRASKQKFFLSGPFLFARLLAGFARFFGGRATNQKGWRVELRNHLNNNTTK